MILWLACSCKRRAKLLWGRTLGSLTWVLVSWLTLPLSIIISIYVTKIRRNRMPTT